MDDALKISGEYLLAKKFCLKILRKSFSQIEIGVNRPLFKLSSSVLIFKVEKESTIKIDHKQSWVVIIW